LRTSEIVRQRLVHQHIADPHLGDPAALVRWMGAVQAQDYRGGLWALGLRLPAASERAIEAAIAARTIVRTWPMRGTLHFVPAEDARWMLRLLTPRVVARSGGRYRELGLDAAAFARGGRLLARALDGQGALVRREAYAVLHRGGVSPEGQRGIHILAHLAQQGLICYGAREGRQPTFVLLDEWLPATKEPSRPAALATLATRYFASHGPATLADFAWWSGLRVKEAQEAVDAAASRLTRRTWGSRTWWVAEAPGTGRRSGRAPVAALLPPWDEYIVAYKDRDAAAGHLDGGMGRLKTVGSPLIVIDGRVRGAWKRTLAAGSVRLTPNWWTPATAADHAALQRAALRYGRFLESAVVS
jgi:hypothetical protein